MARHLMAALAQGLGRPVTPISDLRSFEPLGETSRQTAIAAAAEAEVARLSRRAARPALWVTYHNYYKAPDLLGPGLSSAWDIPYVLIEATRARKRLTGAWASFAAAAERATDAAQVVFALTARDRVALDRDRPASQQVATLPPFLNRQTLPARSPCDGPMLAVGMMRPGDKLASYRLIAAALGHLRTRNWRLDIAGDGAARDAVGALFAPFGDRVTYLGACDPDALADRYQRASLLVWPGVNEAFGMVYLEAQAAGLPIVAQDRPGVRDVLPPGTYPPVEAGAEGLAARLDTLLGDRSERRRLGADGRRNAAARHLMPAAARRLRDVLTPLIEIAA